MSTSPVNVESTIESTTRPSVKEIALALAKPVALVGFGVVCGIMVEKMKNKGSDTNESA